MTLKPTTRFWGETGFLFGVALMVILLYLADGLPSYLSNPPAMAKIGVEMIFPIEFVNYFLIWRSIGAMPGRMDRTICLKRLHPIAADGFVDNILSFISAY